MNFENKIRFLTALKLAIGDQKIDVIYSKGDHRRGIVSNALQTGIEL
jgi:hypothetical protein